MKDFIGLIGACLCACVGVRFFFYTKAAQTAIVKERDNGGPRRIVKLYASFPGYVLLKAMGLLFLVGSAAGLYEAIWNLSHR